MYRKKRNKRSNVHEVMDKTFKSVILALRISCINIPKNALLPSQLPTPVSSSEEEDMDDSEEEDGHDCEEEHAHDSDEDGREQDHWNANGDEANEVHSDSRSPMLDTIRYANRANHMQSFGWHRGARTSKSLSISKGLPFSTGARWVCCGATYLCVGQCGSLPSTCTN
jgi:hypothetical protein